jgi:DNA-binding NtrC family response regulator
MRILGDGLVESAREGNVTDSTEEALSPETAPVLVAARDDSMRRFIALLLRDIAAPLMFAEDQRSIAAALDDRPLRVVVLVSERFGWPGPEVAEAVRRSDARTVFVAHDEPGPGWEFVHAIVQLPFSTSELAEHVGRRSRHARTRP